MLRPLLLIVACISCAGLCAQDSLRDPYYWPFTAQSIWNTPIGSEAVYVPANLEPAARVGVDIMHILATSEDDPVTPAYAHGVWGPGRCDSVMDIDFSLHLPADWLVPDAGNSPYGYTPSSSYAIVYPDGDQVLQAQIIARCEVGGPVYFPLWFQYPGNRQTVSIRGDGLYSGNGQGATGMSTLGGTIRLGELTGSEPIRHAIKLNPWAKKVIHYSEEVPGYRWPAFRADAAAATSYNPDADPSMLMSALLAIPPDVKVVELNLSDALVAAKLFAVMQDYGVYFTEDAAWDIWDIIAERDVELEFENADVAGYTDLGESNVLSWTCNDAGQPNQEWRLEAIDPVAGTYHLIPHYVDEAGVDFRLAVVDNNLQMQPTGTTRTSPSILTPLVPKVP